MIPPLDGPAWLTPEELTPEEFDERLAHGEPVRIKRGARPVSVVVDDVKTLAALRGELAGLAYAAGLLDGETDRVSKRSRRLIKVRLAGVRHRIGLIERAAP